MKFRFFLIIAVFCWLSSGNPARAAHTVSLLLNSKEILIQLDRNIPESEQLKKGDRLPLYSKGNGEIIGYAEVIEVHTEDRKARARVVAHPKNPLVLPGDLVKKVDLTRQNPDFIGRTDLLLTGDRRRSARYKPLVYRGLAIGETASHLDEGEFLFDILGYYSYGVTDSVSISTIGIADFSGTPNIGTKFRIVENEGLLLSTELRALYRPGKSMEGTVHFFFDVPDNSKWVSYTDLAIMVSTTEKGETQARNENLFFGSSISTGYSYVRDNWDRILLGPRYYIETRAVGGYIGYMFIWDHTHVSVNLQSTNITNFKIGADGYIPYAYVFWRF